MRTSSKKTASQETYYSRGDSYTRRDSKGFHESSRVLPETSSSRGVGFPRGGVAFSVSLSDDGTPVSFNMASTGFESIPRKHHDLVETISKGPDWAVEAERLGVELKRAVRPVLNTWFPPAYRKKMASVLARRAMEEASKDLLRLDSHRLPPIIEHGYRHWTRWPRGMVGVHFR